MKLKDLINVLCEYDIIHKTIYDEVSGKINKGLADESTMTIFINPNVSREELIENTIHELYHAMHYQKKEKNSEKKIEKEVEDLKKRLYK